MDNSDRLRHAAAVVFLALGLAVAWTGESAPPPKPDVGKAAQSSAMPGPANGDATPASTASQTKASAARWRQPVARYLGRGRFTAG